MFIEEGPKTSIAVRAFYSFFAEIRRKSVTTASFKLARRARAAAAAAATPFHARGCARTRTCAQPSAPPWPALSSASPCLELPADRSGMPAQQAARADGLEMYPATFLIQQVSSRLQQVGIGGQQVRSHRAPGLTKKHTHEVESPAPCRPCLSEPPSLCAQVFDARQA